MNKNIIGKIELLMNQFIFLGRRPFGEEVEEIEFDGLRIGLYHNDVEGTEKNGCRTFYGKKELIKFVSVSDMLFSNSGFLDRVKWRTKDTEYDEEYRFVFEKRNYNQSSRDEEGCREWYEKRYWILQLALLGSDAERLDYLLDSMR